jgi:excisionase family DNA binding protein
MLGRTGPAGHRPAPDSDTPVAVDDTPTPTFPAWAVPPRLAPPHLYTQTELARLFGVTARTVRRWARAGDVTVIRVGGTVRYLLPDVLREPGQEATEVAAKDAA